MCPLSLPTVLARLHYGHKQEEGVLTQTDGVKTGASVVRVILWTTLDTEPEGHAPALCTFLCVCVYVSRGVSVLSAFVSVRLSSSHTCASNCLKSCVTPPDCILRAASCQPMISQASCGPILVIPSWGCRRLSSRKSLDRRYFFLRRRLMQTVWLRRTAGCPSCPHDQ